MQNGDFSRACDSLQAIILHFGANCSELIHDFIFCVPKSVLKLCSYVIDSNAYNMVYLQLFGVCPATVMSGCVGKMLFVRKAVLHIKGGFSLLFSILSFF
jgi:hypothetical protein